MPNSEIMEMEERRSRSGGDSIQANNMKYLHCMLQQNKFGADSEVCVSVNRVDDSDEKRILYNNYF